MSKTLLLFLVPFIAYSQCPQTEIDWQNWERRQTQRLFSSNFNPEIALELKEEFASCNEALVSLPKAQVCTENLRRFSVARSWTEIDGHSLGAAMSDEAYYSDVPYPEMLELPGELAGNQSFLRLLDTRNNDSYDQALKVIDEINAKISKPELKWISFIYDSQHLATPDNTRSMGRFFVFVPGSDFDRFIQFGIQRDPNRPIANSFSAVAVQKTDPLTKKPLAVYRARLKDFWRLRDGSGKVSLSTRLKEMGSMENCYECHKNAVLPIHPDPSTFDKKRFQPFVDKVNRIMRDYERVDADGYDRLGYGPGLGPETSNIRDDEFIKSCSKGTVTSPERIELVKSAMNCVKCHDGEQYGKLDFPSAKMNLPVGGTMVAHYVTKHKLMPLGVGGLTDSERDAIVLCLKAEYYQGFDNRPSLFRTWFEQQECWNANP